MSRLDGKIALVVGGGGGIGKEIALKLAVKGADIIISDINREASLKVGAEIEAMGRKFFFESCDLYKYESVKEMVDRAVAAAGKIDILIASGGTTPKYARFFHEVDPSEYHDCFLTMQWVRLYCIRAVLDHMKERNFGKIVILTTDAGRTPTPRESLIGASAAGLILMAKALAREFSRWNIRINCVTPTIVTNTPGMDQVMATEAAHIFEKAMSRAPFGVPNAGEVADIAVFMASPETDKITGQTISINGGLSFPG
ncbi:MAG: SDR family NAD(P)-dependent oxidoreductase [Smithellaceae bacterium]